MIARIFALVLCGALALAAAAAAPFTGQLLAQPESGESAVPEAKAKSKGICRAGFDVRYNVVVPPGFPFDGNPPVAVVTFKKPCKGAVLARFTAEVDTLATGQAISVDAVALCEGNGGYPDGCTKGEVRHSEPAFYDLGLSNSGLGTHSADFVWRGLKRGSWRFTIIGAGHEGGSMRTRKLQVEAYQGG